MKGKRVLMIVTSHATLGTTGTTAGENPPGKTGFWLEELAAPYYELADAGALLEIASPLGGKPPADPKSETAEASSVKRFLADPIATSKLAATKTLEDAARERYDAYFVVGGHGVMWDLATNDVLARLLGKAHDDGRVVAAVCHGPAALSKVEDASGAPIVKGRRVAGFSNEEEDAVGLSGIVPFALETRLRELGGRYERGPKWSSFAVRDGKLVTGQNPASSVAVARLVIEALGSTSP
ncbi:MAG: type 1 glutamine amidotransferase domain-containing protein [Deltaproteobacteria bacterium]|nr:type 1 glutamine amidotransferase domain-containing protein [Deltaproteobacteria bacterium]